MYIEFKGEGELSGPARIGRVTFSRSGRSIYYRDKEFQSLSGHGFKSNYFDVATGAHYWISGCKKRGGDRLYGGLTTIDDDVRVEYWTKIRNLPENAHICEIQGQGKYGG